MFKKTNMPTNKKLKHKDNLLSVRMFWNSKVNGTYRRGMK